MNTNVLTDYYFLASSLPPIRLGDPLELSFNEFNFLLRVNLHLLDKKSNETLRRFYDIQNLRFLWMGQELDQYGNLSPGELEEAVVSGIGVPEYVYDFAERYEEKKERLQNYPQLMTDYFSNEIAGSRGFVKHYLTFEKDLRLVLTVLRAKRINRDIMKEFQFEDPKGDMVSHIIAQKDSKTYEPPSRYEHFKVLYEANADNPTQLYRALAELRFETIEGMLGVDTFSIDCINGYMIQLIIAEKWLALDQQKGLKILDTIVREAS